MVTCAPRSMVSSETEASSRSRDPSTSGSAQTCCARATVIEMGIGAMKQVEDAPVAPGDILAGKYRVDRVLGIGGMGMVVAATHIDLDEPRAIKFMRSEARASVEAETRFLREARASAGLKSEHVVRVHDMGRLEAGEPYLVMEFLEGMDLKAIIKRSKAVSIVQAVDYMVQACEALAEAHAVGIIHRDLKPSNLFVTTGNDARPCAKVLDFGISKLTGALAESAGMDLTQTTSVMGSPLYMSPEQMESARDIDARSDIWSLGVMLYETLTRTRPFSGKTVTAVAMSVAKDVVVPPSKRRPEIPAKLEQVMLRCLDKNRDDRYDNVAELTKALAPFASSESQALIERIGRVQSRGEEKPAPPPPDSSPTAVMDISAHQHAEEESGSAPLVGTPEAAPVPPTARLPETQAGADGTPTGQPSDIDQEAATLCMADSHGSLSSSDAAIAPQIDTGTGASWGGNQYPEVLSPRRSGLFIKVAVPVGSLCVIAALVFLAVGQSSTAPSGAEDSSGTARPAPAQAPESSDDLGAQDQDDSALDDETEPPATEHDAGDSSEPASPPALSSMPQKPKPPAGHKGTKPPSKPKNDPFGETWR